ncbi:DMT family transporter [Inmirania thermothiophila]|uniref:EamA-like transporter family protein n=1 Tax=Inmirania thermothiophila TaxID=1750597 RepID=A0A3N1Y1R1_9GAMM|nr:DMT family transporter [Inmirania thermothiophila]ROR32760.1 EamA-like transporter family protein [Inmirania thermothiophila]
MPPADAGRRALAGGLLVTGSALTFALMGAAIRTVSAELPNPMVVFFRNLLGLAVLLPWIVRARRAGLATARPGLHLLRAAAGLAAMYGFFHALARLPLATAVLLSFTAPLFIPFIARAWLGEPLPPAVLAASGIGFVGVWLVLAPSGGIEPAAVAALAAGASAALAMVTVRRLSFTEPPLRIVAWYGLLCTAASAPPALAAWRAPDAGAWLLLIAIGALASTGQLLLTRGYALAPAARIGPFSYTSVLFATALGWALWGELPHPTAWIGAALVVAAGVLATRGAGIMRRRPHQEPTPT